LQRASRENVRANISALFLVATLILIALSLKTTPAQASGNVSVDLFTQKTLFDGKGLNQSSDLFGPQEQVILYAQTLKENLPLNGILVTYAIDGPINRPGELNFYQTAKTNSSGIGQTSFSLGTMNETDAFGTWVVSARVEVEGRIYHDNLSFQVDWQVELISVRTLDGNLSERNYFSNGGFIGFEVKLKNNALTKKVSVLRITVFDELHIAVNTSRMDHDLVIPPNKKTQYIFGNLYLPKSAFPGRATITAAATDENNISYCPQVTKEFFITTEGPIFPEFVDAFVYVECAPMKAQPGREVTITVRVRNEGTLVLKNIQVQTYVDSSQLDVRTIAQLDPYQSQKFSITWNTQGLPQKSYNITSQIQTFPSEADLSDNSYSCIFELRLPGQENVHDVSIVNVDCSKNEVIQGEIVEIHVTVRNNGEINESTNVTVLYDDTLIQGIPVSNLEPTAEAALTFYWNTTHVPEGTYVITSVVEPVPGEVNIVDNTFHDGEVKVESQVHAVHDVAVTTVSAYPNSSETSVLIQIFATVKNLGGVPENFKVMFYYDESLVTTVDVYSLSPKASRNLTVIWDTSLVMEGNYTIKAYIPPIAGEENTANNLYVDGTVWIRQTQFPQLVLILSVTFALVFLASIFLFVLLCYGRRRRRRKKTRSYYVVVARPHI
jgi:hypothetical protein